MSFQTFVTQRLAAITASINAISANAKKIDELPSQSTLSPTSFVHVSKNGVSEKVSIQQIINSMINEGSDHISEIGSITLVGNNLTIEKITGKINNVIYSINTPTAINIPFCGTGLKRTDLIVFNTSNQLVRVAGTETGGSIVVTPTQPLNTLLVTQISVTDAVINDIQSPILGTTFQKKSFDKAQTFTSTGTDVVITLNTSGYRNIHLQGAMTSIAGLMLDSSVDFTTNELPHDGKEYVLWNKSGHDITIKHNITSSEFPFVLKDAADLVLPNNENITFVLYGSVLVEKIKSFGNKPQTSKLELYPLNFEVYENQTGYHLINMVNSSTGVFSYNKGSYNYANRAFLHSTGNVLGEKTYLSFNIFNSISTGLQPKGFYIIQSFRLSNTVSTSQRLMVGLKPYNQGSENTNTFDAYNATRYLLGRDAGDSNLSFFIQADIHLTTQKINTGIPYNLPDVYTLEIERFRDSLSGYMKISTSSGFNYTHEINGNFTGELLNNIVSINNGNSTDDVGFYSLINKMFLQI